MPVFELWPVLSDRDLEFSTEGTIDPLGLTIIGESLGVKLVPGVRERQSHPRFLTAIAAALEVCRDFPAEELAKDRVSPPWMVFEWYLVEGLVRSAGSEALRGVPGITKAQTALRDGLPLSASRYLKTPSIFGFHGVYRLLARTLEVESAERLGAFGAELLEVWSEEQGLTGFFGSGGGPGREWRDKLRAAVQDGLEAGTTNRTGGWTGWQFFWDHLHPQKFGRNERRVMRDALLRDSVGTRGEILDLLVSDKGRKRWQDEGSERSMHQFFMQKGSARLVPLLRAIDHYERFGRTILNAFEAIRHELTNAGTRTKPAALAENAHVITAAKSCRALFEAASVALDPVGEATRFQHSFHALASTTSPGEWVQNLLDHHRTTQKNKPPSGKNAWIDTFGDSSVLIRPAYQLADCEAESLEAYVNPYRTQALWSFAQDLNLV